MARAKRTPLGSQLIARKGTAAPATHTIPSPKVSAIPRGTKETVAVTVRLDSARYRKLLSYGARFMPRKTNQEIIVLALDQFFDGGEKAEAEEEDLESVAGEG
jgi:hypothetical protein